MKIIAYPKKENWTAILQRPTQSVDDIELTVNQIFDEVLKKGDSAIAKYTSLFDGVDLESNIVSSFEITNSENKISIELQNAIKDAKKKY
jgi:histidinol dehydrogenase